MKRKSIYFFAAIILCIIIASLFLFLKPKNHTQSTLSVKKPTQSQNLSPNSPEGVTQIYYTSYEACLKQHTIDLKNIKIQKDCPLHNFTGMAKVFVQENQVTYEDQILCDVGIPLKMIIGKAYIGTDHTATVNVVTYTKYDQYTIPVRLQKEEGAWKIFRVDCDLDGSLE